MIEFSITENRENENNLLYVQTCMGELIGGTGGNIRMEECEGRKKLTVSCPECYGEIVQAELGEKLGEVIAVNYKYEFFKKKIKVAGLNEREKEILYASLIAADLTEDKRYAGARFMGIKESAIDGVFNFRLSTLKKKWEDIVTYVPEVFMNTQLKDFILFLLENKKRRVYIEGGKVYDSHYRRLIRSNLLDGEEVRIVREVLLSGCGEVEINGEVPTEDEYYLKEFYGDKIIFSRGYSPKNR